MKFLWCLIIVLTLGIPQQIFALSDVDGMGDVTNKCTYRCYCDNIETATLNNEDPQACNDICYDIRALAYSLSCDPDFGTEEVRYTGSTSPPFTGTEEPAEDPLIPALNVSIPGMDEFTTPATDSEGQLHVSFIGEYVDAMYRFAIYAMTIVAVVMLMIAGLQYILARGSAEQIKKAKDRMRNAVVGLVLLLAAYNIAFLVNPDLTRFEALELQYVQREELPNSEENPDIQDSSAASATSVDTDIVRISGDSLIIATSDDRINSEVLEALNAAADAFYKETSKNIKVTSASRTLQKQAELFYDKCLQYGRCGKAQACDPSGSSYGKSSVVQKTGSNFTLTGSLAGITPSSATRSQIVSAIAAAGKSNYCPHTSNVAVDIWPEGSIQGYKANVELMDLMAQIMVDYGFCRLDSEAWHFELNTVKRSQSTCKTSNDSSHYSKGPQGGCMTWDYDDHCCVAQDAESDATPNMCSN